MRSVVLDTETTGMPVTDGHRIIEIGCVELEGRRLTGRHFHVYLNPDREIDEGAIAVHGITNEFVADKPRFKDVADEFFAFIEGAQLIIHNAAFDVGFINKELELLGRPPFTTYVSGIIDTLAMAKEMFPGKRNSLDALCDRLDVDNSGRTLHGALLDAELLAEVYINLTRGQDALLITDDAPESSTAGLPAAHIDLRGFQLPVLRANAQEQAAHEDVLAQIDKASGGKTIWRFFESNEKAVP